MADSYQAIFDATRSRIGDVDSYRAIRDAIAERFDASYAIAILQEQIVIVSHEQQRPSVLFRPKLSRDGSQWCALYGDNLQDGVAGFGDSPYSGTIDVNGESFGFIIESGDQNGTVVREWGPADDVGTFEPPKPVWYTFVPRSILSEEMQKIYDDWIKQPWFVEKVGKLNYDLHFAPGAATNKHYGDWAAKRGLKIGVDHKGGN